MNLHLEVIMPNQAVRSESKNPKSNFNPAQNSFFVALGLNWWSYMGIGLRIISLPVMKITNLVGEQLSFILFAQSFELQESLALANGEHDSLVYGKHT